MKILPDYIINYMPEMEEALEELRLSIIDHAYDLLKCLDIDELTSDEIRHKLELYSITVEDMTSDWLPNGRFYRMYHSIKHNRTRQNTLHAIAKSGGQFEGVWSTGFSNKSEYNFKQIQLLRHYELASDMDGYFYISGNVYRYSDGSIAGSALSAIQSDILMAQALPAGYTYLYIPWPRPSYPDDSTYFYNVNMLQFDRLTFVEDCDLKNLTKNVSYNGKYPASMFYNWKDGIGTPWRTPYWFDYHYMNNIEHIEDIHGNSISWPISETGTYYYYDEDENEFVVLNRNSEGHFVENITPDRYIPDQKELYDTKSVFPTGCSAHGMYRTSEPNRLQKFLFNKHNSEDTDSIDENYYIDYSDSVSALPGPYRWDVLSSSPFIEYNNMNHINTYKPFWNEKTPFFDMAQQNTDDNEKSSIYSWFNLKQNENRPQLSDQDGSTVEEYESIISDNKPPVSNETFTSYDRPTTGKLDPVYVAYTRSENDSQGDDADLSYALRLPSSLYSYDSNDNEEYDPEVSYNLILKNKSDAPYYDSEDDPAAYIEGDPSSNKLYLNLNEISNSDNVNSQYNYVTYKKLRTHRLWFSKDKKDTLLHEFHNYLYKSKAQIPEESDGIIFSESDVDVYNYPLNSANTIRTMSNGDTFTVYDYSAGWLKISQDSDEWIHSRYTNFGVNELYKYSSNNVLLEYNIIGIYDENCNKVDFDVANIELFVNTESGTTNYDLVCDAYKFKNLFDLNHQWVEVEYDGLEDKVVYERLDNYQSCKMFKSFSNKSIQNSEATMKMNIKLYSSLSLQYHICGCGEIDCDYPIIRVYDSDDIVVYEKEWVHSGADGEEDRPEEHVEWKTDTIHFQYGGKYTFEISYVKDSSLNYSLDCAYFAINTSVLNSLQQALYDRITAAYVDFTVRKLGGSANTDDAISLPGSIGEGVWDQNLHQMYAKYMPTRNLVYGDEENWWLPREEYVNRGYIFHLNNISISTNNAKVVHKISEHNIENLGIIDRD